MALYTPREEPSLCQYDGLRTFSQGIAAVVFVVTIPLPLQGTLYEIQRVIKKCVPLMPVSLVRTQHSSLQWHTPCMDFGRIHASCQYLTTDRFVTPPPKEGKQWLEHYRELFLLSHPINAPSAITHLQKVISYVYFTDYTLQPHLGLLAHKAPLSIY